MVSIHGNVCIVSAHAQMTYPCLTQPPAVEQFSLGGGEEVLVKTDSDSCESEE